MDYPRPRQLQWSFFPLPELHRHNPNTRQLQQWLAEWHCHVVRTPTFAKPRPLRTVVARNTHDVQFLPRLFDRLLWWARRHCSYLSCRCTRGVPGTTSLFQAIKKRCGLSLVMAEKWSGSYPPYRTSGYGPVKRFDCALNLLEPSKPMEVEAPWTGQLLRYLGVREFAVQPWQHLVTLAVNPNHNI